jgi:predicted RNA-binding Zn ribbon-like protein
VRALFSARAHGEPLDAEAIEVINMAARRAPAVATIELGHEGPRIRESHAGTNVDRGFAAIAGSAVNVIGGREKGHLGACEGPGCQLFFLAIAPESSLVQFERLRESRARRAPRSPGSKQQEETR